MQLDPSLAKQLADAGGWAVFLVLCGLLIIAFHRGWIIPGWLWKIERERADKLVEQLERNTELLAKIVRTLDGLKRDRSGRDAVP